MSLGCVFYAEDDVNDSFLMERAFRKAGILNPLMVLPDGDLAIRYFAGDGEYADRGQYPLPVLALLDLNLAGRPGMDVLEFIRSQPSTLTLPVLILSSSSQHRDMTRASLLGANAFLVKPSDADELVSMAKAIHDFWLGQHQGPVAPTEREVTLSR